MSCLRLFSFEVPLGKLSGLCREGLMETNLAYMSPVRADKETEKLVISGIIYPLLLYKNSFKSKEIPISYGT